METKLIDVRSAESELHASVSGASDGVVIARCLSFVTEEEIYHVCLVDNTATRQLANKRGTGR